MTYTEKTEAYNDRRYSKPWMAIVSDSLTRGFDFLTWDGQPGHSGQFYFRAEPGTLLAHGQKDLRKQRGGIDGYQICMPDGSLAACDSHAGDLLHMPLEARWRKMAQILLDKAVNRPEYEWQVPEWSKTRNERAARYSAMLGVPNPVMAEIADALGLIDHPAAPAAPTISMDAFGL